MLRNALSHPLALVAAGAAIIAATLGDAPATQSSGPIGIVSCAAVLNAPAGADPNSSGQTPYGYLPPKLGGIKINYVNHATQTVTKVDFIVNYRGDMKHISSSGTFSTGAPIAHTFEQFYGDNFNGYTPDLCSVGAVTYADGTTWKASAP